MKLQQLGLVLLVCFVGQQYVSAQCVGPCQGQVEHLQQQIDDMAYGQRERIVLWVSLSLACAAVALVTILWIITELRRNQETVPKVKPRPEEPTMPVKSASGRPSPHLARYSQVPTGSGRGPYSFGGDLSP